MRETIAATLPYPSETKDQASSVQLGTIVSLADDGAPNVVTGSSEPVRARLAVRVTRERLEAALTGRQQCVLVLEDNDPSKPLLVGFLEDAPAPDPSPVIEADVDGRRIRITAADEIVLQCGSASVTLRRNGRVVIRGTYVETASEGTNRIKGGQVQIN
jgi:hypothetical protein